MENDRNHESEPLDSPELIDLGSALLETKGTFGIIQEFAPFSWRF